MRVQISDEGLSQTIFSAWEKIIDGVPQGSVLGPLRFLIYVNNLPKTVNDKTVPILFADDTSIIVKSPNSKDFQTNMVTAFHCVNKWFKVNLLSINIDKTLMRSIRPFMSLNTLKNKNSNSYLNAVISYGLPFWDNSPHVLKIFRMQERITRIMMGYKNKVSCRNLFRRLEILPFVSQYILLLMLFVVNNKILFTLNSENHTKGTRQSNNFYQHITNLTVY